MNAEIFVKNIEFYCARKGEKPTNAARNSGVGKSFVSDLKRGQIPSVAKVQMLAQYLGVTTSQLLGEAGPPGIGEGVSPADQELLDAYHRAPANLQRSVALILEPYKQEVAAEII